MAINEAQVRDFMNFKKFAEQAEQARAANEAAPATIPAPPAIPAASAEQREVVDPNAGRFGVGVAIRTRVEDSDETVAREWDRADKLYGDGRGGLRESRVMRATALASLTGQGKNKEAVMRVIHDEYRDAGTARYLETLLLRNEASSQRPVDGGILVPTETAEGFVEFYRPYSVLGQLGATFYDSQSGSLTLPRQVSGMSASYSYENSTIPVGDTPQLDEITWQTKRLTALYVTSVELLSRSSYAADRIFRNDLGKAMGQKMEHTAINGNGQNGGIMGLEKYPGLTQVPIGALLNASNINLFKRGLRKAFTPMMDNVKWLMNEDQEYALGNVQATDEGYIFQKEMDGGKLKGKPYLVTQNIGTDTGTGKPSTVFYGDFSELWVVREGTMEIKASEHARFEKNQVMVRAIDFHDIAPRDPRAICRSTGARTE